MCCCCPPAINALFCLWLQSGCSKGSVAGALTFFPPDPPLYSYERYSATGQLLTEDDQEEAGEKGDDNDEQDEELRDIVGPTGHVEPLEERASSSNNNSRNHRTPAQQLTDRAKELRKRAKDRNARDAADHKSGVTYRIVLDPRLSRPPTAAGSLEAVKIPSKSGVYVATLIYRAARPSPYTIIYSHGNATDMGAMFALQAVLVQSLECNVVVYDYSGYGESGGVPMEKSTYTDIQAVYKYCCTFSEPSKIILYGQSVGSGPVCHLAYKNNDIGGIILHSPFTSGMRVLTPSRLLACLDIYPNISRIALVRCPTMVIHGKLDEEVNFHHGLEMHNAVPAEYQREPWWVPDRGHNDITEGPGKMTEYIRRLRQFLESINDDS